MDEGLLNQYFKGMYKDPTYMGSHLKMQFQSNQRQSKLCIQLLIITYVFSRCISAVSIPVANNNYEGTSRTLNAFLHSCAYTYNLAHAIAD